MQAGRKFWFKSFRVFRQTQDVQALVYIETTINLSSRLCFDHVRGIYVSFRILLDTDHQVGTEIYRGASLRLHLFQLHGVINGSSIDIQHCHAETAL